MVSQHGSLDTIEETDQKTSVVRQANTFRCASNSKHDGLGTGRWLSSTRNPREGCPRFEHYIKEAERRRLRGEVRTWSTQARYRAVCSARCTGCSAWGGSEA